MASPSSFTSRNYKYKVFSSFHGPDVRQTFLAHLRKQFKSSAISMFDDQGIERSATIAPSLTEAIRESRISIVILSKNYASSGWCLDELLEILDCKKSMGQIVMTIFYGVDPSDVRNQSGDFGNVFNETCARKTDEKREKWSEALTVVGNIAGEHFRIWDNEVEKIEKIAKDVSEKLNATPSKDFDGMVGLKDHLREMESLLQLKGSLDSTPPMIVGICGPAGIGKSTIARALHSLHSNRFQLSCFVDTLRESTPKGFDEYGLKLRLQEEFLSKFLNQKGMRICHLGVIEERLCDMRVLIILDDVSHIKQLEALAGKISWFGPGSRIVVTTENKELLQQHGIDNTYHVKFPSSEEALEILCKYAFRQSFPRNGFNELASMVTELCGKLPLGLRVVGSSLRGKNEDEWDEVIGSLKTILDYQDIEEVLRVGYENLHENEKSLFLHIAVFFNYEDVERGLKILVHRSLIEISTYGEIIVMHKLLQQVGRQALRRQEPWKCQILIDAREICNILEYGKDVSYLSGISFDISESDIDGVSISESAFHRMPNLRFLRVFKCKDDGNEIVDIPQGMELPRRLRLLKWEAYPSKFFPPRFHPEYLVEFDMQDSKLEKLWEGIQPLKSLKKMDMSYSQHLKELPDLSNATNLEILKLNCCESLVQIPSSFSKLQKLRGLWMVFCTKLEVIPANWNLASLEVLFMNGCSQLQNFPDISTNISRLDISDTSVKEVPASVTLWSQLCSLSIGGGKLKTLPQLPTNITTLDLSFSGIETLCCINDFRTLKELILSGCRKLTSLPELPQSLEFLKAEDCESLETVFCPLDVPDAKLIFTNCFKLDRKSRKEITRQRWSSFLPGRIIPAGFHQHRAQTTIFQQRTTVLPGREVPVEFHHRGRGNSLTIRPDGNAYIGFAVCVVISYKKQKFRSFLCLLCRRIGIDEDDFYPVERSVYVGAVHKFRTAHLLVFDSRSIELYPTDMRGEIMLELSSYSQHFDIIDCGARILTEENESYEWELDQVLEDDIELEPSSSEASEDDTNGVICESKEDENLDGEKHTDCWSWLFHCFHLSN